MLVFLSLGVGGKVAEVYDAAGCRVGQPTLERGEGFWGLPQPFFFGRDVGWKRGVPRLRAVMILTAQNAANGAPSIPLSFLEEVGHLLAEHKAVRVNGSDH